MKKLILSLVALCTLVAAQATPISQQQALALAKQYLVQAVGLQGQPSLSLYHTLHDSHNTPVLYIFNIDNAGFILVSGDDVATPVLGYSFNGCYDSTRLAPQFRTMLQSYTADVEWVREAVSRGETIAPSPRTIAERAALAGVDNHIFTPTGKDVAKLVTTEWGQSRPYNNYCPAYSGSSDGHAYVGCVALAMAQVLHYHGYPYKGFGHSQYAHEVYGTLAVNYDSAYYDHDVMPTQALWGVSNDAKHAVALLNYHCGVSVKMGYQHAGYHQGSGAHTEDIVDGLKHFGYFDAYYMERTQYNKATFDSLVLVELERGRPLVCDGRSSEYGHAFICDGYRSSDNKYHFNWGWDGYQDGYYTMDYMNGFSSSQGAVFNIHPSGLASVPDTMYVAADGDGDGSSWQEATSNLQDAIMVASLFDRGPIVMKEGIYYGDTTGENAFVMKAGVDIIGGYPADEANPTVADGFRYPTVMSGNGVRRVLYCDNFSSTSKITGITFADGYAEEGSGALIQNRLQLHYCQAYNNTATGPKGSALYTTGGASIYNSKFYNNTGANTIYIEERDGLKNCLVANNNGNGVYLAGNNLLTNCDIVNNSDTAIVTNANSIVRNCIVWNNGALLSDSCRIAFSAIDYTAGHDTPADSLYLTNSNLLLATAAPTTPDGTPIFENPVLTRGISNELGDWHLTSNSPCRDAGDTVTSGVYRYDMDGNARFRNGRVDMGCYEVQNVSIATAAALDISVYPNPATDRLTITVKHPTTLSLYNAMGQQLQHFAVQDSRTISLQHYPQGLYLLRTAEGTTLRIIKR